MTGFFVPVGTGKKTYHKKAFTFHGMTRILINTFLQAYFVSIILNVTIKSFNVINVI